MNIIDGAGIIVPLLTPLHQDETVNFDQLETLVDYVISGGVNAILAMGSTGEFARFTPETRAEIIARIVARSAGRVPVYAGVGDTGLKGVLRNVEAAVRAGAGAIAATLPYYYPIRTDEEAVSYYRAVAAASPVPVMLYNIPSTCGASLGLGAIERLFDEERIIGIKDSGGDLERLLEEIRRFKGRGKPFSVVVGSEELSLAGMKAGADGIVPSMANPFPELFRALYAAARAEDWGKAEEYAGIVDEFNRLNGYSGSWMAANVWRKRALHHLRLASDVCTAPYVPVDAETDKRVAAAAGKYRELFP